jgi:hypothetical protein
MTTTERFTLSEQDIELLPSDEDVAFYAEHGWYLSKKLFTDAEIDELVAASEAYYAGARDRTLPVRPPRLAYWTPDQGDVQRHNDYVHYESDPLAKLLLKPVIGAVAARLAQAEEIRVFQSTLIYKPPIAGLPSNIVPWHFDKHYWASSSSENMLTAFIPFHDCTEEMGTITMSLMSLRLPVGPVGIHGTVTHVSSRCNDFSSDMKSQTAKTWCSMKVTMASCVSRPAYSGCCTTRSRAAVTAFSSRSIPGCVCPQSYLDNCLSLLDRCGQPRHRTGQ